jgi:hypothetical protein
MATVQKMEVDVFSFLVQNILPLRHGEVNITMNGKRRKEKFEANYPVIHRGEQV